MWDGILTLSRNQYRSKYTALTIETLGSLRSYFIADPLRRLLGPELHKCSYICQNPRDPHSAGDTKIQKDHCYYS